MAEALTVCVHTVGKDHRRPHSMLPEAIQHAEKWAAPTGQGKSFGIEHQ